MTTAIQIRIRGLYKVFGPDPEQVMPLVYDGIGKQELLDRHGHVLGLRDVSLDIADGSLQVVMGLSGCGKSTLVRHINRLIEPTAGEILIDGEDIRALETAALQRLRRHRVSMVFQRFALFPHRTVMENVGYGLSLQGVPKADREERVEKWIGRVGLSGYEDAYPDLLSGGMQQRVGLARALATDADILLMDEPFSALDPLIRTDMQALLLELQQELRKTIVFITHDLDEALALGDRTAILRDGEIIQNGNSQQIVLQPANDYIAAFTRDINRGRVIRVDAIMDPPGPAASDPGAPCCAGKTVLDDALALVSATPEARTRVVDESGAVIGSVTLDRLVDALTGDLAGGGRSARRA